MDIELSVIFMLSGQVSFTITLQTSVIIFLIFHYHFLSFLSFINTILSCHISNKDKPLGCLRTAVQAEQEQGLSNSKEQCASCASFSTMHSRVKLLGGYKSWLRASPTLAEALALQQNVRTGLYSAAVQSSAKCWPANLCIRFHYGLAKILSQLTLKLQQSVQVFIFVSTESGRNNFRVNVRWFCEDCACNKPTFIYNRMPQMGPVKAHCLSPCFLCLPKNLLQIKPASEI